MVLAIWGEQSLLLAIAHASESEKSEEVIHQLLTKNWKL